MFIYLFILRLLKLFTFSSKKDRKRKKILATATFYSDNWIKTLIMPIAENIHVENVCIVASDKVPVMNNVTAVYPPKWLKSLIGSSFSRMLTYLIFSFKYRPDIYIGFHLLFNGLMAGFLSNLFNKNSIYICGGGVREVEGGGYRTENKLFSKIGNPDELLEKQLLESLNYLDYIVTMGSSAKDYFENIPIKTSVCVNPGGVDDTIYSPDNSMKEFDIILIGRLSKVKRVERLIEANSIVRDKLGKPFKIVIVGSGPEHHYLQDLSKNNNLERDITFAGWQDNIDNWLKRSKLFALTSESEGLSQAMLQALMCGLPAVVSDVGDLSDAVRDKYNGLLVKNQTAEEFAEAFIQILSSANHYNEYSKNAIESSREYNIVNSSKKWNLILG